MGVFMPIFAHYIYKQTRKMKIEQGKYVAVSYDLTVGDEKELMERATKEKPLTYIAGISAMLEAFEENLNGLSAGDKFSFTITPEQAYGEYDDDHLIELPKNLFEIDGKFDTDMVFEGNMLPMLDSDGNRLNGMVVSVADDTVQMDFNHPLAGETLHFAGEVLEVREATVEEIAALTSDCECNGCGSDASNCGSSCCCN